MALASQVHHDAATQVIYHPDVAILDEQAWDTKIGFNLCQRAELAAIDDRLHATCRGVEPSRHERRSVPTKYVWHTDSGMPPEGQGLFPQQMRTSCALLRQYLHLVFRGGHVFQLRVLSWSIRNGGHLAAIS